MKEAYNRTSTAYDFALFDTTLRKPKEETEKAPELEVVSVSASKRGNPVAIIIVAAMFTILLMAFILCKAALSEVNLRVSQKQDILDETKATNTAIMAELNGSVSLEQVEQYAVDELGMQKVVHAQEQYIEMDTGAMTENAEEGDDGFLFGIGNWISGIVEYLGI